MPERSCIACRKKGGKGDLVRLADTPSGVVPDYNEKLPGRGAYVCAEAGCIKKALTGSALSKAFRKNVKPPDYGDVAAAIVAGAERKISSLIGIARKSGKAAYGHDSATNAAKAGPGGLLITAADASDATLSGVLAELDGMYCGRVVYKDKEALGLLMGGRPVAVVYIADRGISSALLREFARTSLNTGGEN